MGQSKFNPKWLDYDSNLWSLEYNARVNSKNLMTERLFDHWSLYSYNQIPGETYDLYITRIFNSKCFENWLEFQLILKNKFLFCNYKFKTV